MAFERKNIHDVNLESAIIALDKNPKISKEEKEDIKEFLRLAKLGRINKGLKLTDSRCLKYINVLRIPLEYFTNNTNDLTLKEVERFDEDLCNDLIRNKQNNKPLAQNTKVEIRKLFKIYLRWKLKDDVEKFTKLTEWWDTTYKKTTPDFLSEEEIIELIEACKNKTEKFLILVLFDAGCRIGEFLNLRCEDVIEPMQDFPYYMLDFKEEYSKTFGRKIGLFWNKSEKIVKDYLEIIGPRKRNELLFEGDYDNIRKFIGRLGKRVLNRRVIPHLFRHSSATYYANKMNRQELCIRYGWSFTSDMPDTYISRAGINQREIMKTIKAKGMEKYKEENDNLQKQITELHLKVTSITNEKQSQDEKIEFVLKQIEEVQLLHNQMNEYIRLLKQHKQEIKIEN